MSDEDKKGKKSKRAFRKAGKQPPPNEAEDEKFVDLLVRKAIEEAAVELDVPVQPAYKPTIH